MKANRLLLCTDMDRTIIPNGRQPEHPKARSLFRRLCKLPEILLVYVTGRHLQLVKEAIAEYNLPEPEYAITDVGTKIYRRFDTNWYEMLPWIDQIAKDWQGKTHSHLKLALDDFSELVLQEDSKQSDYKLSYYLPLNADHEQILKQVDQQLKQLGVAASLIMSSDEPKQTGLLDILPLHATKLHAIKFLQQHLGYGLDETIFSGDSGNDLAVLGSSIRAILVANAEPEIKQQALSLAKKNGCMESIYLAEQENFPLGGNYTAGVLQGVVFYHKGLENHLNYHE